MNDKGKSGEIGHPNENNDIDHKKALDVSKGHITQPEVSGASSTRKLESTTTSKLGTPEWTQQQLDDFLRGSGRKLDDSLATKSEHLSLKDAQHKADELGVDLTPGVTQKLQNEATQKLEEGPHSDPDKSSIYNLGSNWSAETLADKNEAGMYNLGSNWSAETLPDNNAVSDKHLGSSDLTLPKADIRDITDKTSFEAHRSEKQIIADRRREIPYRLLL